MPKISIVTPCYNAEKYIRQTIQSVQNQTFADWEYILVDDGSADATGGIVAEFSTRDPRIRLIRQENAGVAASRNNGLSACRDDTDYVCFLDHDDLLEADALERLSTILESDPNAVAAYGLPCDVDAAGAVLPQDKDQAYGRDRHGIVAGKLRPWPLHEPTRLPVFVVWPCISTPGQVLIRRRAIAQAGLFDVSTAPSDDWDMWIRLSEQGDFVFSDSYVMRKRSHGGNLWNNKRALGRAEPQVRRKLASHPDAEVRRVARLGHLYSCAEKARWASESCRQGRYVHGLKQFRHAVLSYVGYLRLPYRV